MQYNTQQSPMVISEYGRIIQELVVEIAELNDRIERTKLAEGIVQVMISLNPQVKELDDYEHKLWDHLYIISNFSLDVDGPFEPPTPEGVAKNPEPIPYKDELIKFRFYGRNLQTMVEEAVNIEDEAIRKAFINYIGSFMVNSSRNWNDENLDKQTVITHLKTLSKGTLELTEDDLEIYIDNNRGKRPYKGNKNKGAKTNNYKSKNWKR